MEKINYLTKIVSLLANKPMSGYQLYKLLELSTNTLYRLLHYLEEQGIIAKKGNLYVLNGKNVFNLGGNCFLILIENIPVIINCPYWDSCQVRKEKEECFGDERCLLYKKLFI